MLWALILITMASGRVEVRAMGDIGASHNFLAKRMAKSLCLNVTNSFNRIKVKNSASRDGIGVAANILVTVGIWVGYMNFFVVFLDNFDLILENDFFL